MVEALVAAHLVEAGHRPGLRVGRPVDHPPDAAVHQRAGAHHARLQRHVEGAVQQPPVPHHRGCVAQRQDLRMRRRVASELAPQYNIDPALALAIASTESNFDPAAASPKSALGVMQLIPETAERFNVRNAFDPAQNIKGGLAYLRWLLAYFQGNVALVAAGYNAGEGAVDRYRGVPPYRETRNYVDRILTLFKADRHPFERRVVEPSPMLSSVRVAVQ